ncbi:uncharacterized protein LOC123563735 [Mercenaria mercenaria]|uniref:uncharacterized protein LOC123563735 n=1 Tax=Mercenaria mercenaria TaxID=6596 RepID=UPI00234E9546|nr:uncharacterized protein LOC123563735 [Mercenaria mercenaria]
MHIPTLREILKSYLILITIGSASMIVITVKYMRKDLTGTVIDVKSWLKAAYFGCGINFIGYGERFAVLRYAHIDPNTKTFSIPCTERKPDYYFVQGGVKGNILTVKEWMKENILNDWMENMTVYSYYYIKKNRMSVIKTPTFAVNRVEAHNLYHAMCEWYSLFLISYLLNFDPKQVAILFMDDRPPNILDETWDTLFGEITRYNTIPSDNVYKALIWNIYGYESLMNIPTLTRLPYVTEFRNFILDSFKLPQHKSLNCNRLRITVILRRDYRSHPELTSGIVLRKFYNNSEVLGVVQSVFYGHEVRGIYLEYFSMKEQIEMITQTDILVGMHGAGMSHILFLPKHAACFEIFPKYVNYYTFFKAFSRWRRTKYVSWKNQDSDNEFPEFKTKIPIHVLVSHLKTLKRRVCI